MNLRSRNGNNQQSLLPEAVVEKNVVIIRSAISGLVLLWAVFFAITCQAVDDHDTQTVVYQSVWSQLYPASLNQSLDADTLQGRFLYAVSAHSLDVAK